MIGGNSFFILVLKIWCMATDSLTDVVETLLLWFSLARAWQLFFIVWQKFLICWSKLRIGFVWLVTFKKALNSQVHCAFANVYKGCNLESFLWKTYLWLIFYNIVSQQTWIAKKALLPSDVKPEGPHIGCSKPKLIFVNYLTIMQLGLRVKQLF